MTDFNGNTSKTRLAQARIALTQRMNSALQQLKALKKIDTWSALLKPEPLRRPRAHRAGVTMFDVALWTLVLIPVLVAVLSLYNGVVDTTRGIALRSQLTRAVAIIERDHTYSGAYGTQSLLVFLKNEGFTKKELHETSGGGSGDYEFTSPYGTAITITGSGGGFVVTLAVMPASGCETAAMTFVNSNSGLKSLVIGSVSTGLKPANGEISQEAVMNACDHDENTLTLTF